MRTWHLAHLTRRRLLDEGLVEVSLSVPPPVWEAFSRPGQFTRVRLAGSEAPFAIASPPGSRAFDYLVRRGAGVSDVLASLPEGAPVEVAAPEGRGFPVDEARGRDLLLVCTGTALAPCRSVLHDVARRRAEFGRVTLLQGQRSPRQVPWLDELRALPAVQIHTVVAEGDEGWAGPRGLVQSLVPGAISPDTVAFLVGQREMTDEVAALLERGGVSRGRVFLNV